MAMYVREGVHKLCTIIRAYIRVILLLYECIWNAPAVSLVLIIFDDTGFLGYPPRRVDYPSGSTLGN